MKSFKCPDCEHEFEANEKEYIGDIIPCPNCYGATYYVNDENYSKAMDCFAQEVYEEVIEPHDKAKGR